MQTRCVILAAFLATAPHAASAAGKPSIVLIFADDLGYGDLGCYGATKVKNPRIDSLATDGRRFTDAHSASAVCSPSRYGLLTGSYPMVITPAEASARTPRPGSCMISRPIPGSKPIRRKNAPTPTVPCR